MAMPVHFWLTILLSAVAVFVASSLIHMLFKWHNRDYRKLPNEDAVRAAINAGQPTPGLYVLPHALSAEECKSEDMQKRFAEGPIGKLMLRRPGAMSVGPMLLFGLNLVVALVAACMAAGAMSAQHAAHTAGLATLLAYGAGAVSESIWMGKPWAATLKDLLDAVIYAAATAAVFMWLWP
jgi:hypothetical protein